MNGIINPKGRNNLGETTRNMLKSDNGLSDKQLERFKKKKLTKLKRVNMNELCKKLDEHKKKIK